MKTKRTRENVYVVEVFEDNDASCTHTTLYASSDPRKARRRLHKEIRAYIDSWHAGDGEERLSRKDYYRKGFIRTGGTGPGKPRLIETWVLDEDDTYVEYSMTEVPLDTVTETRRARDSEAVRAIASGATGAFAEAIALAMGGAARLAVTGEVPVTEYDRFTGDPCHYTADALAIERAEDGSLTFIRQGTGPDEEDEVKVPFEDLTLDAQYTVAWLAAAASRNGFQENRKNQGK